MGRDRVRDRDGTGKTGRAGWMMMMIGVLGRVDFNGHSAPTRGDGTERDMDRDGTEPGGVWRFIYCRSGARRHFAGVERDGTGDGKEQIKTGQHSHTDAEKGWDGTRDWTVT